MQFSRWLGFGMVAMFLGSSLGANKPEDDKSVVDGVRMTVVFPERIEMPAPGGASDFEIGLRIENRTAEEDDLDFDLFDTVRPVLKDAKGEQRPLDGGRDGTRVPKPMPVKARQAETVTYPARLTLAPGAKTAELVIDDLTGGIWVYHDLMPGRFTFSLEYTHPPEGRVAQPGRWVGAAKTKPVEFVIGARKDAKGSE
jgi:hypothetical protein